MAGPWWMTVMLIPLLSAGGLAAVDQNKLAELLKGIKKEYKITGMFSLALSIQSEDPDNLKQVFLENPNREVEEKISKGEVYKGQRLAIAKVKQPEHAEWRVLKDLKLVSEKGDLLVIYSYASPCPSTCTKINSPYNIIHKINNVINTGSWSKYAFVFEKVFKPKNSNDIEKEKLIEALKNLGTSKMTLDNIFRCYKPQRVNSAFQCISCSKDRKVEEQCIDYNAY